MTVRVANIIFAVTVISMSTSCIYFQSSTKVEKKLEKLWKNGAIKAEQDFSNGCYTHLVFVPSYLDYSYGRNSEIPFCQDNYKTQLSEFGIVTKYLPQKFHKYSNCKYGAYKYKMDSLLEQKFENNFFREQIQISNCRCANDSSNVFDSDQLDDRIRVESIDIEPMILENANGEVTTVNFANSISPFIIPSYKSFDAIGWYYVTYVSSISGDIDKFELSYISENNVLLMDVELELIEQYLKEKVLTNLNKAPSSICGYDVNTRWQLSIVLYKK